MNQPAADPQNEPAMSRWSHALAAVVLVALWACQVHAGPDIDLTKSGPGAVERISDVDSFEKSILMSEGIWVVVFTSTSTDEVKSRGVNREACDQIAEQLTNAAIELNALNIKVGIADIDDLHAIASEFNVRKRMLPVALLFKTRARDADKLKSNLFGSPSELKATVQELLVDNPRSSDGTYQKITLTLGGGEL